MFCMFKLDKQLNMAKLGSSTLDMVYNALIVGAFPRSFLPAPMICIGQYTLVVVSGCTCAPSNHHQCVGTYTYHRKQVKMISETHLLMNDLKSVV